MVRADPEPASSRCASARSALSAQRPGQGIESIAESTTDEKRLSGDRLRNAAALRARLVVAALLDQRLDPHRVALLAEDRRRECATVTLEAIDRARRVALGEGGARLVEQDALRRELRLANGRRGGRG